MTTPLYATLTALRRELHLSEAETSDDARLLDALRAATDWIDQACGRSFAPRLATITHPAPRRPSAELTLHDDLLALTALEDDGGMIAPEDVALLPESGPASLLRRTDSGLFSGEVRVTGLWGWHIHAAKVWLDSGDSITDGAGITADAVLVSVDAVSGANGLGENPRFQVGQLLSVGTEYLLVTATDAEANTLGVVRAVQGSTPQAHAAGTPILVFQPMPVVRALAVRIAAALARREPLAGVLADAALPVRPRVS
ncbi:MAG: hypothetical protein KME04_19665 [Pleurocapsa minor GSE-CHR-MK-17-07R]|jgi:hypothetical protein|nr:hypothetical protein [Pleurocapsa minor GSE-CHR-MK 17-07R]